MSSKNALTLHDISWLRQASRKDGAPAVPADIAKRLIAGGFAETLKDALTITPRGRLALTRLG